jgi:hypothetical protein
MDLDVRPVGRIQIKMRQVVGQETTDHWQIEKAMQSSHTMDARVRRTCSHLLRLYS